MTRPAKIIAVRPRRDGQWEVVQTTDAAEAKWRKRWDAWYEKFGVKLAAENPGWWRKA